jgi:outer membrane protein assembly factor BamB
VACGAAADSLAGLYFGSEDGRLYSVYADTGRQAWQVRACGAVRGTPVVVGDIMSAGTADSKVHAVATTTPVDDENPPVRPERDPNHKPGDPGTD